MASNAVGATHLMRNPEVARFTLWLGVTSLVLVVVGFIVGPLAALVALAACLGLTGLFWVFTRRRYRRLAELGEQIDRVLHGADQVDIAGVAEGELSILGSEIHKLTVRLREQAEALRADKAYLADSLADVAHQLRTPMTSIRMLAGFLAQPGLDDDRRLEFSRELDGLLNRVDWLLTALLKIATMDAGTARFQRDQVSVRALVARAVQPLAIPLDIQGVELDCSGEDAVFTGDLDWTAEALGNVLKNCLEHAPAGSRIGVESVQNPIHTQITVTDQGPGIDPADLPQIFDRFYQGRPGQPNSSRANFGVGLALARMILAQQNATIRADNPPGGGARFTIRFYHQPI